jgi:tetratricopeptide (TPR) repeat protein
MAAQRRRHLLERALTLDPLNRVTETNYLNELWRSGEREQFWTRAEERLARDPDYPTAHYQLAWTRYGIGEFAEATRIFVESPTGMPSVWPVMNLLMVFGDDERAMQVAENVPEDAQEYEDVRNWIEGRTDPIETIRARAEAILAAPQPDPAGQNVAQRLISEGDYALTRRLIEHAFPTLQEEIPRTRGDTNILAFYAKILYLDGDVPRAREMAEYSLAQNRGKPATGPGSRGTGDLLNYLVLGRHEDAIEELQTLEEAGYRFWYSEEFDEDPLLDPIRDDPRVQAVREAIDVALAAERDACLALLSEHGYI